MTDRKPYATPVLRPIDPLLTRSGEFWAIELPGIPGAYTQGRTEAEARANLQSLLGDLLK